VADVEIRQLRHEDAAAVAGLLGQLGYPAPPEAVERRLVGLLDSEADLQLVAVEGSRIVGLAGLQLGLSLEYDGPVGKLSELVVDEDHRGQGLGRMMVQAVEREARARGCVLLYLTTAHRRKSAHAFYERVGFVETGKRYVKELTKSGGLVGYRRRPKIRRR
jgi:aminoglycoside 6'-N-acetyltransferase I